MDPATVTVRFIRSFEQRNIRHVVYKNVDLSQIGDAFLKFIKEDLQQRNGVPPPVKKYAYDTLKIQHLPHGAKSTNPVINTETDALLDLTLPLSESGVVHEAEISCFKLDDYKRYKENPETKW